MAHLRWGKGVRPVAVNFIIDGGLNPGATVKLGAEGGAVAELVLDNAELMRLVIGLKSDSRFKINQRPTKPDRKLNRAVDDLLGRATGVLKNG